MLGITYKVAICSAALGVLLTAPTLAGEWHTQIYEPVLPVVEKTPIEIPAEMIEIARCESGLRQFDENGEVLRGKINPKDVGIFQINEYYHLEASRALGYDIYTREGNIGYAIYLYNLQGTQPWNWSRGCWDK